MTEKEKQYFEIMLEQILHEVKTVAEGHCALDEKLERFHKEAKEDHQLAMGLIKHSHDALKEDIYALDTKLTSEIREVGSKVEGHEERIQFLERKAA